MTVPHYLVLLDENGLAMHTYQLMSSKRDSRDECSRNTNDEKTPPANSTDDVDGRNSPALYNGSSTLALIPEALQASARPADEVLCTHGVYAHPPLPPLPGDTGKVTPKRRGVNPPTTPTEKESYAWLGTVRQVWKKHYPSGHFPKNSGRDLKFLIKEVGEAELGRRLDAYLTSTGAEYINLAKFAQTSDAWARKVPAIQPTTDLDAYEQAMRGGE